MRVKFRIDPAMACDGKGDFSTPFREGEYIGFTLKGEVAVKLDDGTIHSYCVKAYEIIIEPADACPAKACPASESPQT